MDSATFKKFKVKRVSENLDPNQRFSQDPKLDKIKSDLIVETCEDVQTMATATIRAVKASGKHVAV